MFVPFSAVATADANKLFADSTPTCTEPTKSMSELEVSLFKI